MVSTDSDYNPIMDGHESEASDTNSEIPGGATQSDKRGPDTKRPKKARRKPARVEPSGGRKTERLRHKIIFDEQCDRCARGGQSCYISAGRISICRKCEACQHLKQACFLKGVNVCDLPYVRPHKPERKKNPSSSGRPQLVVELIETPMHDVERSARSIPGPENLSYTPGCASLPIVLQDDSEMETIKPDPQDSTISCGSVIEESIHLGPATVRILKTVKEGIQRCQMRCQALSSKKSVEYFSATAAVLAEKVDIEVASATRHQTERQVLDKLAQDLKSVATASSTAVRHPSNDDSDDWLRACATCETLFECCVATIEGHTC